MRKQNGSGVQWTECSLIIGTGCCVQVFSSILDSSVGLSASIQSAGDSIPKTLVQLLNSAEEDNSSPFDLKIACLCQSIEINNNKHAGIQVNPYQLWSGNGHAIPIWNYFTSSGQVHLGVVHDYFSVSTILNSICYCKLPRYESSYCD